jgi:hypothetical protein
LDGDGLYEFAARAEDLLGNRESGAFVAQTSTIYDTTQPSSLVTWAPEYERGGTITGTWEATPSQAPITRVDLWVRPVNGVLPDAWTPATPPVGTGGATSGEFSYEVLNDGVYYFATVAYDAAGKQEPAPYGEGDRRTIRDSQIGAPLDVTLVQSQEWSTDNDFGVVWTHPEDLSGIAAATYQLYPESGVPLDPVREYVGDPPEIEGIHVPSEGRYTLWLWLEDEAGNVGTPAPAVPQTVLKYDRTILAPISPTVQPGGWSATNDFDVSWVNPDEVSGIAGAYYKLDTPPFWAEDGTWVHGADLTQIEGITVPSQGAHMVYVWLKDVAGNVNHRRWSSTSLRYDASPPEDVSMIAPSLASSMLFEVGWGGSDFHSGIISYTVAVSGWPTYQWEPWLISTTQTSALYRAPRANDRFDFRVTAYDRAGNSAQDEASTMVDLQLVYLPFGPLRSNWRPWHEQDIYEENNTAVDAYGPLEAAIVYESAIWNRSDPTDFYYFVPSRTAFDSVTVDLDMTGAPYDLDLAVKEYNEATGRYDLVGWSGELECRPERIRLSRVDADRKYWIQIIPDWNARCPGGSGDRIPYELRVIYP